MKRKDKFEKPLLIITTLCISHYKHHVTNVHILILLYIYLRQLLIFSHPAPMLENLRILNSFQNFNILIAENQKLHNFFLFFKFQPSMLILPEYSSNNSLLHYAFQSLISKQLLRK